MLASSSGGVVARTPVSSSSARAAWSCVWRASSTICSATNTSSAARSTSSGVARPASMRTDIKRCAACATSSCSSEDPSSALPPTQR